MCIKYRYSVQVRWERASFPILKNWNGTSFFIFLSVGIACRQKTKPSAGRAGVHDRALAFCHNE